MGVPGLLKEHFLFLLILLAAACLRFIPFFDYQFTYDEISALQRVHFPDVPSLVHNGIRIDAHPALLQLLIFFITQYFGIITWLIKLPFLLMSLGTIIYAYRFGLRYYSKSAGQIAAVVFSFALVYVYYAPIARMYCSGMFFSIALLYHLFAIVIQQDRRRLNFVLLTVFMLLGALNHHINALYAGTIYILGFSILNRNLYKAYLLSGGVTILLYLPHLPVTLYQLGLAGIGAEQGGWLAVPEPTIFFDTLNVLCGSGYSLAVFSVLLLISGSRRKNRPDVTKLVLLFCPFVLNFLIVYLYSVFRAPIYQHSVMLFSGVGFILVVASLMTGENRKLNYLSLFLLTTWLLSETYYRKSFYTQAVKTVYEYQFERTIHYKALYGEDMVYPVYFEADSVMRSIYFDKYNTTFECSIASDPMISDGTRKYFVVDGREISSVALFSKFIAERSEQYIVLGSAPPLYQAIVKERFPYLIENTQTQGIHLKVYARSEPTDRVLVSEDSVLFETGLSKARESSGGSGRVRGSDFVEPENEFPPGLSLNFNITVPQQGQVVLATAFLESDSVLNEVECCVAVADTLNGETLHYTAMNAGDYLPHKNGLISLHAQLFAGDFYTRSNEYTTLNVYLWNRGNESFYVRGLELKVIDHWWWKWHFWD